jgi:hypothetical protein
LPCPRDFNGSLKRSDFDGVGGNQVGLRSGGEGKTEARERKQHPCKDKPSADDVRRKHGVSGFAVANVNRPTDNGNSSFSPSLYRMPVSKEKIVFDFFSAMR